MNSGKSSGYIWFDAEFTSINLETAKILQVAAIATDINLNPIDDIDNYINLIIKIEKNEPMAPCRGKPGALARCGAARSCKSGIEGDGRR